MKLATRLSVWLAMLTGFIIILVLLGATFSFVKLTQDETERRMITVATMIDSRLVGSPPELLDSWLNEVMLQFDIAQIELTTEVGRLFISTRPELNPAEEAGGSFNHISVPLLHLPGTTLKLTYQQPDFAGPFTLIMSYPLAISLILAMAALLFSYVLIHRFFLGQVRLTQRAEQILKGERGENVYESDNESPIKVSQAIDLLLSELNVMNEKSHRLDTLIRTYAAQDSQTGLNNWHFFENQLATLLDGQEQSGAYGIVMIIRLPDFDTLKKDWQGPDNGLYTLINLLEMVVRRYPGALLARYFRNDFAVLMPHRTIKEADGFASQLLHAVETLPPFPMIDNHNMLHIGICAWRNGQSRDQIMERAEFAVRNAALQGMNNWSVYDDQLPEKGRGSVQWRTLLEQTLKRGGPHLYQKPAVNRHGEVQHRQILCRIIDGEQEILSGEYLPMVVTFGLSEQYDRSVITQLLPLLSLWPTETFAIPISVESLIRFSFQDWVHDTLIQYDKSLLSRIIFELAEADVCQHIYQLRRILRLITGLGAKIAVTQAGLTVVSTAYVKAFDLELIKLHPALVRNIGKRAENQLFVQSLIASCKGSKTRVFAAGVRTRSEWRALIDNGISGGQGDFIAASQPLDTQVKKYSQRYSV